jgi:DNA-binding IclR family transcriptional regulator
MNRSVLRAISLLKVFQSDDEWVSASEISRRAALPFASTHRLLQTLEQTGAVDKGDGGSYRLGYLIASLSQHVNVDDCLHRASRDLMASLARRLEASIYLGRLEGVTVALIGKIAAPMARHKLVAVGSRFAAHTMALGRVLLADLPIEEIDKVVKDQANILPTQMSSARFDLVAELALIRKQGFAVGRNQPYPGFGSVAVGLRDNEDRVFAALAASEELHKLTPDRIALIRNELLAAEPMLRKKILPESSATSVRRIRAGNFAGREKGAGSGISLSQMNTKVVPLKRVML